MKKVYLLIASFLLIFALAACDSACVGPECAEGGGTDDAAIPFTHVNGHGAEVDRTSYLLFEYELATYVKYQITYLSCTCRDAAVNYWQVAYVEINISTNDIKTISFGQDGEDGHYIAGMWGDSSPTPGGKTTQDFVDDFLPWLVGKSLTDLEGITVFSNDSYFEIPANTTAIPEQELIDDFAGSSVSTNNMIRVMKELLRYHEENYN
ncbi:hypothetical protein OAO42_00740 [Candidatus Izimaplasma bacterium]|nr:hypothetical protein [Candidatus Izimaplasma bacterium]